MGIGLKAKLPKDIKNADAMLKALVKPKLEFKDFNGMFGPKALVVFDWWMIGPGKDPNHGGMTMRVAGFPISSTQPENLTDPCHYPFPSCRTEEIRAISIVNANDDGNFDLLAVTPLYNVLLSFMRTFEVYKYRMEEFLAGQLPHDKMLPFEQEGLVDYINEWFDVDNKLNDYKLVAKDGREMGFPVPPPTTVRDHLLAKHKVTPGKRRR
jgi:hypothetical protein